MEALQVVVADRHDALTGDRNRLVRENVKRLKRLAESGEGHQPELLKRLFFIREKIKPSEDIGSLRGILSTLRHLTVTLRWQAGQENARIRLELAVIEKLFENAQKLSAEQVKVDAALERYEVLAVKAYSTLTYNLESSTSFEIRRMLVLNIINSFSKFRSVSIFLTGMFRVILSPSPRMPLPLWRIYMRILSS